MSYFSNLKRCLLLAMAVLLSTQCLAREPRRVAATPGVVRMIFVGDMNLDTNPGRLIEFGKDPFRSTEHILAEGDVVIGNLECAVGIGTEPFPDKKWTFQASPKCIPFLAKHFDAVSLANNHALDFGRDTFLKQLDLMQGKVGVFGGGRNVTGARTPWVVERNGLRIAVLGYNEAKHCDAFEAGPSLSGVAWSHDADVLADIRRAREELKADVVIPMMHWGLEMDLGPSERQLVFGRQMVDAGATAVIGAHPHVTQHAQMHRGRPLIYSLGNFVFDGFEERECKTGWIARLTIDKDGVREWDVVTVTLNGIGIPSPDLDPDLVTPYGDRRHDFVKFRRARLPELAGAP